jgi:hypothetical protein
MQHIHMISTTDPITLRDVSDTWGRPYVVEGDHYSDITIYFESEETRQAYLDIPVENPSRDLSVSLDNPTDDYPDAN